MFCPNCGKGDQSVDTYCRSCGEFLPSLSDRFSLISKALGMSTPGRQLGVSLTINLLTGILSFLLLMFLNGYFDALATRTAEPTPTIIYVVYLFLGLVAGWQFLSFVINLRLRAKFTGKSGGKAHSGSTVNETNPLGGSVISSLPEADLGRSAPASVTEDRTRILDDLPSRKR
jgi:hypothetical protein